ncbi:P-loop containing nucleoside triphosphate hydrolase protein [Crucibulum laeve]|uniref:ATP-dependent RNA helicase n=1 Tax=Crucibulum laeve TaxID=68775 RepID=A0A5C3M1Y7_9AGAR|nr:P-loop containing nucleoside triphosphate hydrolase protein [Crucibulum laeve]
MASYLWSQVTRACARNSTRAVRSAPVFSRSFVALSRSSVARPCSCRQQSSLATAKAAGGSSSISQSQKEEETRIPFTTLEGKVHPDVLRAITKAPMLLTHMSPVQAEVLPLLPGIAEPYNKDAPQSDSARDLLVKAKTGTGKTLAFLVPAVESRIKHIDQHAERMMRDAGVTDDPRLAEQAKATFARQTVGTLVISPTRELANQIVTEAIKLTSHLKGFEVQLLVGGESKSNQLRQWSRARHDIVVATPGRLRDLLMSQPNLILDEADTLLDMGFHDDIEAGKEHLPHCPQRQTFLFFHGLPRHAFVDVIYDISPVHAHVPQYHTILPSPEHQIAHLVRLIAHDQLIHPHASKIIVFFPTTKMTQLFASLLREASRRVLPSSGHTHIYELHSKRQMAQRTSTSDMFRNDNSGASILVTSDVSARGVDYPGVTRVIQVGVPSSTEQYIHRVGRTGRAGTSGRGDIVLLPWEMGFVTWQLTEVPLKPLTVSELTIQLSELSSTFDQDPASYLQNAPPARAATVPAPKSRDRYNRGPRPSPPAHMRIQTPITPVVESVDQTVTEIQSKLVEESVSETFMSLLGYYMGRSGDLRISREAIVEGCKSWATKSCGLPVPPYVSAAFLQKLGLSGMNRRNSSMSTRAPSKNRWEGRGSARRDRDREGASSVESDFKAWDHESGPKLQDRPSQYGFRAPREGQRQGGYGGGNREGGYAPRSQGSYGDRSNGGYGNSGGYNNPRESGYGGGRSEGGYRGSSGGNGGRW